MCESRVSDANRIYTEQVYGGIKPNGDPYVICSPCMGEWRRKKAAGVA